MMHDLYWPEMFRTNVIETNEDKCLANQLVAWGNVFMGATPPDNFYEIMEAASKITGAFTSTECNDAADKLLEKRKRNLH